MKSILKRICAFLTALVLVLISGYMVFADEPTNKFNVVFVMDASGSMNKTDSDGLRYEAMDLFLSLLANNGNYVGDVIFTQTIDKTMPPKEMTSFDDKRAVMNDLRSIIPSKGDTNIGLAIATATDMLDAGRNKDLDSIILLLSDGNTDLKEKKAMDEADYYKQYAIQHARTGHYKIYCIGLNADGSMNASELNDIASSTGGEFIEVQNPNDMSKVTESFYKLIFNTPSTINPYVIDATGKIEQPFNVPSLGVEEVNIITRGRVSAVTLYRPDGTAYSQAELDQILVKNNSFNALKLVKPDPGDWKVVVSGDPGNEVIISMIVNTDMKVVASTDKDPDDYNINESIKVEGTLQEQASGNVITDINAYNENKAVFVFKNLKTGTEETVDMTVQNGKYYAEVPVPDVASYEGVINLSLSGTVQSSNVITFNVGNKPPVISQPLIEDKIVRKPFFGGSKTYDLSQYASDDIDSSLTYQISNSSFNDEDVTLSGSNLTVSPSKSIDGDIEVLAVDSSGASSPIKFSFNVISMAKWMIVTIILIALIILAVIASIIIKLSHRKYYGKIMIKIFDKNTGVIYNSRIHDPYRGKQPIRNLDMSAMDVGLDGTFLPKDKTFIYYQSKTPFYCTTAPDPTVPIKKVEIALGMTTTISATPDFLSGADISYM